MFMVKKIDGYNYSISVDGVVTNLKTGKILKHFDNTRGYKYVYLWNNAVEKKHYIHRLIAAAFIPNPENKKQINHKDGNPSNNAIENLEWVTNQENNLHAFRVLKRKPSATGKFGKLHHNSIPVIATSETGETIYIESIGLTKKYGFTPSAVYHVLRGNQPRHKKFTFKYA
jgi:hypothetical protein